MNTSSRQRTVLIITHDFVPISSSAVQRTLQFSRYLPQYGWHPIILTANPAGHHAWDESLLDKLAEGNHTLVQTPQAKTPRAKGLLKAPGRRRIRWQMKFQQVFLQPEGAVRWRKHALESGRKVLNDVSVDVILATAPPFTDFLVARQLSEEYDVPFVVDYQDLWVDNPFHLYITPFHKRFSVRLESRILKTANTVLATSRHTKESLLRRYPFLDHNDIRIIEHGYDAEDFRQHRGEPDPHTFTITHSGTFPDNRSPRYFLKALQQFVRKHPAKAETLDVRFVGALSTGDRKLVRKYKLDSCTSLLGHVSHAESLRHIAESDVLWLMYRNNVRGSGKLFEYLGARKPLMVHAPEGNIRTVAENSGAAVITNPDDVAGILKGLEHYYDLWSRQSLPRPSTEFVERFDRRRLTEDLARVLGLAMNV